MARGRQLPVHPILPLAGLALETGRVFLSDPLSNLSKNGPDKISVFLTVYVYVYFITPVTFYLNLLSLFVHATAHAATLLKPPIPVFLKRYLPRAARVVSLANLLLVAPLLVHLSVAEQTVDFGIGAALVVLSLVLIFSSVFKKVVISNCHADKGFMPAFSALCISISTLLIASESMFKFDKNHRSLVDFIPIHQQLLSLVSFFVFMLGIALLFICIVNASAGGPRVPIHAQNLLISALCAVTATLLVGWYIIAYMSTVTGVGSVSSS